MHILIDSTSGAVIGFANSADYRVAAGQVLMPAPDGFDVATADEWAWADGALTRDPVLALSRARSARIAAIKQEAAALLEASAWRVQRVQERELAGFASLADVAAVLAERESVRRSSDAAEAAVTALTDMAAVQAFTWAPDAVTVQAPRLLTHEQFIQRFSPSEWEALTNAARVNAPMDAWMRRLSHANFVNLDDPATQAGVQALEMAGLLLPGRAAEVLA